MQHTLGFRSDIEGLRGIAVLLVIFFHAKIFGWTGGFIGVDIFFVISGYLISGLFIIEIENRGTIDLLRFYARRARRLLPAALTVICLTLFFGTFVLSPIEYKELTRAALSSVISVSNLWFLSESINYFAADTSSNSLLHTWSLAVEEQFYLVWPLFFLVLAREKRHRQRLNVFLILLTVVSLAFCIVVSRANQPWAFFGTPLRAWEFGVGALAFVLPSRPGLETGRRSVVTSWIGLGVIALSGVVLAETDAYPGALAVPPVLGAALLLRASNATPRWGARILLASPPMLLAGRLSYSWYLWHWPVLSFADVLTPGPLTPVMSIFCVVLSFGLSAATYFAIENPLRRHKALVARDLASLAAAAALVVIGFGVSYGSYIWVSRVLEGPEQRAIAMAKADKPKNRDCVAEVVDTEPQVCTFGLRTASTTIVLFGDSHAFQWLPVLEKLSYKNTWKTVTLLKSGCSSIIVPLFYDSRLKREYVECSAWRELAFRQIVGLDPDIVIIANSVGYVRSANRVGFGHFSYVEWRLATDRTFERLGAAGIRSMLVRDNPRPGVNIPACLSKEAWRGALDEASCAFDRRRALDPAIFSAERAAAARYDVTLVDLTPHYCSETVCPAQRDGIIVYRDGNHLTNSYALHLSGEIEKAIRAAIGHDVER